LLWWFRHIISKYFTGDWVNENIWLLRRNSYKHVHTHRSCFIRTSYRRRRRRCRRRVIVSNVNLFLSSLAVLPTQRQTHIYTHICKLKDTRIGFSIKKFTNNFFIGGWFSSFMMRRLLEECSTVSGFRDGKELDGDRSSHNVTRTGVSFPYKPSSSNYFPVYLMAANDMPSAQRWTYVLFH